MPEIPIAILAVSPGRSRLGIAVFRNGALAYYGGKSLRQYRSESDSHHAIRKFLIKLFLRYGINKLAMADLNKQQLHSSAVVSIDAHIRSIARQNRVTIQNHDAVDVRRLLCEDDKPTKDNLAQRLVKRYGELGRYQSSSTGWERRYYGFVFSAIAIGEIAARDFSITAMPTSVQITSKAQNNHGK